jgi:hypothetical protein
VVPRQIDTISMPGMLIGDTSLSLVAVSSLRSNQPSAHVGARFHPLAQPPESNKGFPVQPENGH